VASPDLSNAESVPHESPQQVTYETLDDGRIARIWLDRPEAQNAQSRTLLVQLDEAFAKAEADDAVRVVILAGRGKNFSAGHDLGSDFHLARLDAIRHRRANVPTGMAFLLRKHPQVARSAKDHDRPGAGQCHFGWTHVDLGV
jgi:enoyl-CoA hydratase/carnithine racemase